MQFHHGITAQELTAGILPMPNADTAIICLIAISDDADDDMYPLDTPVLLAGIKQGNLEKAGENGTLGKYLRHIRDIHNPTIVVLRLSDKTNTDSLEILRSCKTRLGVNPNLITAPEIDTPAMVQKLVTIAKARRMVVYANPRTDDGELITDIEEIIAYRDKFGDRELVLIENAWLEPSDVKKK